MFYDYCTWANCPGSILFVDITCAFATLLRRILFDEEEGDESWLLKLHHSGFDGNAIADIVAYIRTLHGLHNDTAPPLFYLINLSRTHTRTLGFPRSF